MNSQTKDILVRAAKRIARHFLYFCGVCLIAFLTIPTAYVLYHCFFALFKLVYSGRFEPAIPPEDLSQFNVLLWPLAVLATFFLFIYLARTTACVVDEILNAKKENMNQEKTGTYFKLEDSLVFQLQQIVEQSEGGTTIDLLVENAVRDFLRNRTQITLSPTPQQILAAVEEALDRLYNNPHL